MSGRRLGLVIAMLVGALLLPGTHGSAQTPPLTSQDVIKMVRAELSAPIIRRTIESAATVDFDLSPDGLIALKGAGVPDEIITSMQARLAVAKPPAGLTAPEKSEVMSTVRGSGDILRSFKTLAVDARQASFFDSAQMVAELRKQKDFNILGITIVDDAALADVVLQVSYTFAWDYPYKLVHQNTSVVLLSGTGSGPFSGPEGARSVAAKLVKQLRAARFGS